MPTAATASNPTTAMLKMRTMIAHDEGDDAGSNGGDAGGGDGGGGGGNDNGDEGRWMVMMVRTQR